MRWLVSSRVKWTLCLLSVMQLCLRDVDASMCNVASKRVYGAVDTSGVSESVKRGIEFMKEQPLAIWYTDRDANAGANILSTLRECQSTNSIPLVVLYGLPNKDCNAGESSAGSNKSPSDYTKFVQTLADSIASTGGKANVIVEPDALALSIDNCGANNNYVSNMQSAVNILSAVSGITLYVDVGFWMLIYDEDSVRKVANILKSLGKVKGVSLNLSNYRSTSESVDACKRLRSISGIDYTCVVDTSRNNNGPSSVNEWCNYKGAGIGKLTDSTDGIIDALVWIKPAIEVDGHCYGRGNSFQSSKEAGGVDLDWFALLWNQGYYSSAQPTQTTAQPTQTTAQPTQTTAQPTQTTAQPTYNPATVKAIDVSSMKKICKPL